MLVQLDDVECDVLGSDLDRAFAAWYTGNRSETKAMVIAGYVMLAHGLPRIVETGKDEAETRSLRAELDRVHREYGTNVLGMQTAFIEHVRSLEASLEKTQRAAIAELAGAKTAAEMLAFQKEASLESERLRGELSEARRDAQDRAPLLQRIRDLEAAVAERDRTLAMAMKTNQARGNLGEGVITAALAEAFPDSTVRDASKDPHATDIHVTFRDGRLVAFEVKLKDTVTRGDLDKFYGDVRAMQETVSGFSGAVFVSLASRNIPGKGDLHMELCNSAPVVFVGFEAFADGDSALLARVTQLTLQVHEACSVLDRRAAAAADVVACACKAMENVQRLRAQVDKARAAAVASIELADAMRKEVDALFDGLGPIVPAAPVALPGGRACKECGAEFKTASGLARHMSSKHANP